MVRWPSVRMRGSDGQQFVLINVWFDHLSLLRASRERLAFPCVAPDRPLAHFTCSGPSGWNPTNPNEVIHRVHKGRRTPAEVVGGSDRSERHHACTASRHHDKHDPPPESAANEETYRGRDGEMHEKKRKRNAMETEEPRRCSRPRWMVERTFRKCTSQKLPRAMRARMRENRTWKRWILVRRRKRKRDS